MTIQANFPAIKPSLLLDFANTKQLDSRITYTRASTASYYDGVTTSKAEENLLIRSAEFDNATWGKTRSTVTANAVAAPDGTTTAESLDQASGQTSSGLASQYLVLSANSHVFSVFAKANTKSKIFLRDDFNSARSTWFDLSAGTVGTTNAGHTASITSVGSSWYRCVIVFTSTAQNNQVIVGLADTDNSTTVTDSGGVYVWGAQLEQRSAVSAYTATTTQAITNYIPKLQSAASGVARFDNNPTTGESLGLLIEESRTNLLLYSSQFDDASWSKSASVTVTANQVVSPNGTLDADQLNIVGNGGTTQIYKSITVANATAHTMSLYVKYYSGANGDFLFSMGSDTTRGIRVTVSASLLTISEVGANVTASGFQSVGNGWFRIYFTVTSTSTSFEYNIYRPAAYGGSGTNSFFIWGAQLEVGAFATSYIPTVASQVTRAADAASMTGTNFSTWFNNGEGMFYSEGQLNYNPIGGGGAEWFSASDGTQSNKIAPYFSSGSGILFSNIVTSGVEQANTGATVISANVNFKYASVYKVNDFASVVNSGTASTDASGVIPYRLSQLVIGDGSSVGNRSRYYKKLAYYPIRVTNAQLQALTS